MSFPSKLKELRLSHNLTQEQLAQLIEASLKTYRNYEAGKTTPGILVLRKLVIALETTADELLEI